MDEYLQALPAKHLEPLWSRMGTMVPPTPNPIARPYMWRYEETLPCLVKAGKLVPEEMAERRVLMLVNPGMDSPHTTDTIYGGLQMVNPGETAPAHRHIATACRFIIDGEGFTAVQGKKMPLIRGDVVVTPSWYWHDHGNESSAPVVWLDALNLPLFTYARVHFAEGYGEKRHPSTQMDLCEWRHPWAQAQEALDGQNKDHAIYHYRAKGDKPLSTTLGVQAERIGPGVPTETMQDSSSFIYHCYEGRGHSIVESPSGERVTFNWVSRDTFAVPSWSKLRHVNGSSSEPAYLVGVHDGPFLDLLGLRPPKAQQGSLGV
ncbi:Uncharacterized protein TPAR_08792 [Tolypocladium paradoxum]|uniref:Cupin type-2 domain-containing protein n=1 Tax=Tolypocladium paradoxum TaxID=94208 RepID=A0A2S4KLA3_9HYPO|nr:Uncharacterized protein TPAR_08792 [Tolypocladium paradoxum]